MNIADLYPTIQPPYTLDDLTFEYTDTIANLTATYGLNIAHPYVMGYIPIDYTPDWAKISILDDESSEDNYSFKPLGDADNYPWFFLSVYTTALSSRSTADLIYSSNTWNVLGTSNLQYRFVNGITIQSLAQRDVTLRFGHFSQNRRTNVISGSTGLSSLAIVDYTFSTFSDFKDWLDGTIPYIQISFGVASGITETFKLSAVPNSDPDIIEVGSGMARTTVEETVSGQTDTYDVWAFIADYKIPYQRMVGNNSTSGNYPNLSVALQIHDTENSIDYIADMGDRFAYTQPALRMNNTFTNVGGDLSRIVLNDVGYYKGGFSGEFPKNMTASSIYYTENNNFVVYKASSYWYFFRCISPYDILKLIQICGTRFTNTSAVQFGKDDGIYFPLYNTDNSPKMELLDGSDIDDDLRDWQIYNVNYNEFTWDDIPIYVPPTPPEPPSGEESGDSIDWQERYYLGASNFITQYAMYDSQVQTFGQLLWTSWFSQGTITDMWKNFILVVNGGQQSDTGSYDVSSVMDFIVSLQIFPFALDAALAQDTTDIKIGMGAYPLQIGSTMKKILTTVIYLDFGSIVIPRPYGDFRDYDNMSISAVLPYCGTCELNPGDVVGRTLDCMYCVDLQTGNCHAMIKATDDENHYYPVASLDGQLSANIALSATNESRLKAQRTMDAVNFAKMFTAPVLSIADTANSVSSGNKSYSGVANTLTDWAFMPDYITAEKISRGSVGCPMISGGNGLTAFMQPEQPYVQMRYGLYSEPSNYDSSEGKPNTTSGVLSSFSGFTVCRNVNVDTIHCHSDERAAIKAALESGVYL